MVSVTCQNNSARNCGSRSPNRVSVTSGYKFLSVNNSSNTLFQFYESVKRSSEKWSDLTGGQTVCLVADNTGIQDNIQS